MTNARLRKTPAWIRGTAVGTLACFLYVNVLYAALEPARNLWQERRAAARISEPSAAKLGNGELLAQLPSVGPNLLAKSLPAFDAPSQNLNLRYAGLSAKAPGILRSLPLSY